MKRFFNAGLILSLLLYTTSCGDEFLDVNVDPNNPNDAPLELVLPAAIASTAGTVGGDYAILGGIWSQYYTQNNGSNQYKDIDTYNIQNNTYEGRWQELYAGALNDYKFIKNKATTNQDWNGYLMATVMEAYTYQVLVDLYDKIPFEEALTGNENLLQPKYQEGSVVYDSLITRLNSALAKPITATANAKTASGDIIFNGDMDMWVRFANTLKLKMYLRQVYAREAVAKAGIEGLYAAGANFLTGDASLNVFSDATSRRNPLFEQDQSTALNTNQNLRAANTLFSYLQANNDPRLEGNYVPGSAGQKSMVPGTASTPTTVLVPTSLSRARISPIAPVYFISTPESYFLQAEAVLRGYGSGDVVALYNAGIDASYEQLNTVFGLSIVRPTGSYVYPATGTFEQQLEAIIMQKWVALAGTKQGIEAFFERNRTNYPATSPVAATNETYVPGQITYPEEGVTTGQAFPKRLIWPSIERTRNPNTPTQEPVTKEVWWDVH